MTGPADFGAIAARLTEGVEDVRACLLVSADGMTLGVSPRDREADIRGVWDRLRSVGDVQRGFIANQGEVWALARRGPYAGVVVAGNASTPGLVLDRLESAIRSAEGMRVLEESSAAPGETTGRPESPLDRESGKEVRASAERSPAASEAVTGASGPDLSDPVRAAREFIARILGTGAAGNGEHPAPSASEEPPEGLEAIRGLPAEERAPGPDVAPVAEDGPVAEPEMPAASGSPEETSGSGSEKGKDEVDPVALVREFRDLADEPGWWP